MESLIFENKKYYFSDYIYKLEPYNFPNCSNSSRKIVKVKNVADKDYLFLKFDKKGNKWVISNSKYPRAKLLLSENWCHNNVIKFKNVKNEQDIELENSIAPEILELHDSEKFKDDKGNILNIEVRGERNVNECYFKCKDVEKVFNVDNLCNNIQLNNNYIKNNDYKLFRVSKNNKTKKCQEFKKYLFLTYEGILRVLFTSRNNKTRPFIKWATKILFTHQLGTNEEKRKLVDKLLGCDINTSRDILKCNTNDIASIYLITLGYVKDLKNDFNLSDKYNDNDIICKYGYTDNLNRRLYEHKVNYNKIKNVDIRLKYFSYIDKKLLSKAEMSIKETFDILNCNIDYQGYKELVVIPQNKFDYVKKEYDNLRKIYCGDQEEYLKIIDDLKHQYQLDLRDKDMELKDKEIEIINLKKDKEMEILNQDIYKKEIEILKLKLELATKI